MDAGVMIDLGGRHAVVTGGSRGVGRATALMLGRAGASVGIGYRTRTREAEEVVGLIRGSGGRAWAERADVSREDGAEALFSRATAEGGLDIVVVNAGIWPPEAVPVAEMASEQWLATVQINLTSAFYTVRAAARRMKYGGSMVLVASTAAQRGEAFHADYAASKGGMVAFTKSVALELAPARITVNCVAPGWVDTEMAQQPLAGPGRAAIEAAIPLGRVATAEDVAGPIVFLCSPLARHLTGEVLNVNGGSVLCG
jgi:3-oxoacyl-[acyl-carrier protein] reductase